MCRVNNNRSLLEDETHLVEVCNKIIQNTEKPLDAILGDLPESKYKGKKVWMFTVVFHLECLVYKKVYSQH